MISIYVDEEDKTAQISDWKIFWNDQCKTLQIICYFSPKGTLTRPLSDCRVAPIRELDESLLMKPASLVVKSIEKALIYGERYAVVHFPGTAKPYIYKMENIEFVSKSTMRQMPTFQYLVAVANARMNRSGSQDKSKIAANVVRQLNRLPDCPGTALNAYCTGRNGTRSLISNLIFPFGVNESQLAAVERAFSAQVSMIEGPPGTGKTQTILNILANILLCEKTVAVLSNNNSAVENVYEKLEKCGLDHLVAKVGSQGNRESFFNNLPDWPKAKPEAPPPMDEIQAVLAKLKQHLYDQNRVARLQAEIDELTIERRYLQQWQDENEVQIVSLEKYGLSPTKITDLMAYIAYLEDRRIRIKDRIELFFNFRIFRARPFSKGTRLSIFYALQMHYYDKVMWEKGEELSTCKESLARAEFDTLLETLTNASMRYLKYQLHKRVPTPNTFDAKTYRQKFDAFVSRFPILGSSTHSIVNSIAQGAILDYVIIDEASQQDIVPGILALGCARNLIVVGDSRQLAHIPVKLGLSSPSAAYDCERYSLLDSCIAVFQDTLPRTLLKEHYRCHPRIIQFCNQQFYDNALVPMTQDSGELPLRLVVTAKGNHARGNTNLRELDSLLKVIEDEGQEESVWLDGDGRGYIAPYRAQVTLSDSHLPEDFVKDTVHKFQGRECDEIVFSTVLDKKRYNQRRQEFVDNPRMVNVAVSRAKHRFTLVTGDEVFTASNAHIAALIRYIEYYGQGDHVTKAPVVSAFDLLYEEYDQSLERLRSKLRSEDSRYESEQIIAQLIREALSDASNQAIVFHGQVLLSQVASQGNPALTPRELRYMRNRASCDFVLYYRVGKVPLGVIEVDGGSHDRPEQAAKDALKNSILEKSDLPIMRLRTVESRNKEKISRFLAMCAGTANSELLANKDTQSNA